MIALTAAPRYAQVLQDAAATGTRASWRFLDEPEPWVTVLVVLPVLAAVSWIGYRREGLPPLWRATLASLRFGALAILFGILCRPVLVERREEVFAPEVLVLVDDSASMQRADGYRGDAETRSAVEALVGDPSRSTRIDVARAALERELLPHLASEGYQPALYGFSESLVPLEQLSTLSGRGRATHVGDAVLQALSSHRGRHVTDVLVLSDGRNTGGSPVLDAAQGAGSSGIPVHTLVLGDTRPEKNAVVELVEAPNSALEGDEVAIAVRVSGRGTNSSEQVTLLLEELFEDGSADRVLAEEVVELSEFGERVVVVAGPGRPDPETGQRRFRLSVPPLAGETLTDDNRIELGVHISPEKIRVLYVDGYPRWEYRFLKNLLLRADDNIDVQCFLLSATSDFPQESTQGLASLAEVPTSRRELLDSYDVVILGDVNPYEISPDPTRGEEFADALREFVQSGGGLLFQAGEYENPRSFPPGSPLEELLPVLVDPTGVLAFEGDARTEFRPELEDPAQPHEIVRLHPDAELNRRLWETEEGLRGFYWYSPVEGAKPSSQVLLRHPTDQNRRGDRYPLLVAGYYPSGRTLFVGVDSTYRWRFHYGDRYHERFWRNSIRWLALGRLRSGDRRFRLETPRTRYPLDERVPLVARVLDEDYRPSTRPSIEVRWSGPDGRVRELVLPASEARDGRYRASVQIERPGLYRAWVEADGTQLTSTEFEVVLPSKESADPTPDPEALGALAVTTGGASTNLVGLASLLDEFPGSEERREPVSSNLDDAWDHWGTLVLALLLLAAEWIGRKRWDLI